MQEFYFPRMSFKSTSYTFSVEVIQLKQYMHVYELYTWPHSPDNPAFNKQDVMWQDGYPSYFSRSLPQLLYFPKPRWPRLLIHQNIQRQFFHLI